MLFNILNNLDDKKTIYIPFNIEHHLEQMEKVDGEDYSGLWSCITTFVDNPREQLEYLLIGIRLVITEGDYSSLLETLLEKYPD